MLAVAEMVFHTAAAGFEADGAAGGEDSSVSGSSSGSDHLETLPAGPPARVQTHARKCADPDDPHSDSASDLEEGERATAVLLRAGLAIVLQFHWGAGFCPQHPCYV